MYTAFLDSCVLWPSTQRDFLLSMAFEGSYRFIFSEAVLAEIAANEELKRIARGDRPDVAAKKARHLAHQMRENFSDSIVSGWEGLEGTYGLPDGDDEHVLAAAVVGGAGSIVTENLRDFPLNKIPDGIQILTARDFCYKAVSMHPVLGLAAVEAMASRSGRQHPRRSPEEILNTLNRFYGLDSATALIRVLL